MVRLHIKRGDENQFLIEANMEDSIQKIIQDICAIFNGRLKIQRICYEMEELANHGITLPADMIGLTDEQISELKLTDSWADKCIPSGGYIINVDEVGRRNGRQPQKNMQDVLKNAMEDARQRIDKKLILNNQPLTLKMVEEALNILRGAVTIVYPMQLPPHDPIRMEFTNTEELEGTQASKDVIEVAKAQLWFAGHQMLPDKFLKDYSGKNNKCKLLIKITKSEEGPPAREMAINEDIRKRLMADAFRRQEELKVSTILKNNILIEFRNDLSSIFNELNTFFKICVIENIYQSVFLSKKIFGNQINSYLCLNSLFIKIIIIGNNIIYNI